ncbi:MAG: hypothetical protein LQ340_003735 [Diploschistes diacapsis]|nr:MAG: hypothetical protein LQ340_003735 [Diploschistes diacapsis]
MNRRQNAVKAYDSVSDLHEGSDSRRNTSKKVVTILNPNIRLEYDQLPPWLQDNAYIKTGYRPPSYSVLTSLRSIFTVHNETVNIQTHLFGAFFFARLSQTSFPLHLPSPPFPHLTLSPSLAPLLPFYVGAISCLTISGLYHATLNVSPGVARWGNQADYIGILALITGSFVPSIYYGFHCHPNLQRLYWTMIVSIGLACGIVTVDARFRTPAWRAWRAAMFVAMGLSAIIPIVHGLWIYGFAVMEDRIGLKWLVGQGVTYIVGAGIYAMRIPEKWVPRRFDIVGASHQIFHVYVLIAAFVHLVGLLEAAEHMAKEGAKCRDVL